MRFGAALHLATFLTGGLAFSAAAVGGNLSPLFTIAWVVVFVAAAATPERRFKSGIVLGAGLLAGPALGAAVWAAGLDPILAAVYFASVLLVARLLARPGIDGHGQAHLLSILVLAGGAAVSPDITYLIVFVAYLFSLTFALLLLHLRREAGEAALALPVREVVGRELFLGTAVLAVFGLVFTGAAFMIFPRATFGIGMARVAAGAEVGLSDRIELAGFGRLKENDRPVMRVWSDIFAGSPEILDLYWRTQSLEIYDGRSWRSSGRELERSSHSSIRLGPDGPGELVHGLEIEVVNSLAVPVLPVPDQAVGVRIDPRDSRGGRMAMRRAGSREVRTVGAPAPPYGYSVRVDPASRVVDDTPVGPEHLALPEQHPALVLLSERLFEESGSDPMRMAETLERWLSTSFAYSPNLPRDPSLEHFLLERRAGHCEYFATAMAVMLRLQGVPARVVIGFHGGSWNQSGGYYLVRQGDAHAWVEVYREGVGWQRYEPTPPAGIGRGVDPKSVRERLADLWDSIQSIWARNVLSFDRGTQRDVLRRLRTAFDEVGRAFEGGETDRGRLVKVGGLVLGVAVVVVAVFVVLRSRRGRSRGLGEIDADAKRARDVYRVFLRALRACGIERRPHETSEEVMEAIESAVRVPDCEVTLARVSRFMERYNASRFGGRPLPAQEARGLMRQARRVAEEVSKSCR